MSMYWSGKTYSKEDIDILRKRRAMGDSKTFPVSHEESYVTTTGLRGDETLKELVDEYFLPFTPFCEVFVEWSRMNLLYDDKAKDCVGESEIWKAIALSAIYQWKVNEQLACRYNKKYLEAIGEEYHGNEEA